MRDIVEIIGSAETPAESRPSGFVWLVGAGPGAADLLTLRAQRALQDADVLVHDRLVPEAVVALANPDAARIYVGKAKGAHAVTQDEINALLVRLAREGKRVARVKAGDPLVYGRAGEEMQALRDAGIAFEVIPGVTAAFAAAAAAEIPLTLRDKASSLVFVTGHDMNGDTLPGWAGVALSGATVAVYMGRTVAGKVAARLIEAGIAAATPAAAVERAAQADQRLFAGTLADLAAFAGRDGVDGPVLILIGDVVAAGALAGAEPLDPAAARLAIAA